MNLQNCVNSRDEQIALEMNVNLYKNLKDKIPESRVPKIVREIVDLEVEALNCALVSLNKTDMVAHVKYVTNMLCKTLGYSPAYREVIHSPFNFTNPPDNFFSTKEDAEYTLEESESDIF